MVGISSIFGLSAVAVDKDIVGKDSDAELIGGVDELSGFTPVDREVACAGCGSALDLGETEKSWDRRWDLTEGALMAIPPFPDEGEEDGGLEGVSLEELLLNRRGIARGKQRTGERNESARFYRRRFEGGTR